MHQLIFGFGFGLSFTSAHVSWKSEKSTWPMWVLAGIIFWGCLLYI